MLSGSLLASVLLNKGNERKAESNVDKAKESNVVDLYEVPLVVVCRMKNRTIEQKPKVSATTGARRMAAGSLGDKASKNGSDFDE